MAAAASGFSTSMVALKSLHCNTSSSSCSSCQFRIICKPIFPKRRFVRRGASIVNPRCEAVSSESSGDKGGDSSSMSAFEQLKASSADITLQDHDHVLQIFLKERYLDADFVSKASDLLWLNNYLQLITPSPPQTSSLPQTPQQLHQVMDNDNDSGLLKLTKAYQWVLGDKVAPPINNKPLPKEFQNDSELRNRLNILKYDAIKREMMLLTIVVGTICSGFCLVALSVQVAISYAAGALLSCVYLQLLCHHVDNLSRESVPQVFMQKKSKKIGIRSEDVRNLLEKVVKGSAFALSSPRLMIPAAIYGFWGLSNHFSDNLLGFQLVPAMFGMFAYKAAALVQVYRDNEDLLIVFPESWEGSSN